MKHDILKIARKHLQDLAAGKTGQDLAEYYSKEIEQIEYPNSLNPKGGFSDYKTLLDRAEQGKLIIVRQTYDIQKEYATGNTVILELVWTGVFNIPLGQLATGQPLRAHFALFMEFEDGKIVKQRNYDCFDAF